jgi:hypothetical protein
LATGVSARLSATSKESRELRRFGLLVGGILAAIAVWPAVFRGAPLRFWELILACGLIALGLAAPRSLKLPYKWWMGLGHALAWFNTRIILGATYFLFLTPIGVAMRLLGRDPLDRHLRDRSSYWVTREAVRDRKASMELRF